jgi:phosphatidylethanolamine-binding protein (PEBP) family uncharacterized protein
MLNIFTTVPLLLLASTLTTAQIPSEFTAGFDESTITLVLSFGGNEITSGESVPLADTKVTPTFALGDSSAINTSSKYIVVGIDPDAPSREDPTLAQVLHYMNTDFSPAPGQATNLTSTNDAETKSYAPPGPPEGTGPHRYIFLLFRQPRTGFTVKDVPEERVGFDVEAWRSVNGLQPAAAGTYFIAQFNGISRLRSYAGYLY